LKADEVLGEGLLEDAPVMREGLEDVARRKRNMEKEPDPVPHAPCAEHRPERNQVVVVDPEEIVRGEERHEPLREELVDPPKGVLVVPLVANEVEALVKERPEDPVGIAAVVAGGVGVAQGKGRVTRGAPDDKSRFGRSLFGVMAAPADPEKRIVAKRASHGREKTALSAPLLRGARKTVRDEDETHP